METPAETPSSSVTGDISVASKKRQRSSPTKAAAKPRKRKATSGTSKVKAIDLDKIKTPPPQHILVVDNGGDTLKFGWADSKEAPQMLPNVTARLMHQLTVLVGDELAKVKNPGSLHTFTRSMERGIISNLGNQTQVWKRMLDILGVAVPLHTDAAAAFGWKPGRHQKKSAKSLGQSEEVPAEYQKLLAPHTIAVLLLLPPHCPRLVLEQILAVWMEDFGVSHVGFGISQAFAGEPHPKYKTSLSVDLGWSATHIVPCFKRKLVDTSATRRMPLGGRHLIGLLKYHMSYRQYNLMDQESILRDVLERLAYVSLDFSEDLMLARRLVSGRRPYDRDYVLPDYQKIHEGQIRLPPALERAQMEQQDDDDDDDEDDEDVKSEDTEDDGEQEDQEMGDGDNSDGGSEEEESAMERRSRILREREAEARRRRALEEEEQILRVSVERFTIPEALFKPQDVGVTSDLLGLAPAILQSVEACPRIYQAALLQSIVLTGGLSKIPNLKERLYRELRPLVPVEYELEILACANPLASAWNSAREWVSKSPYSEWSISKNAWDCDPRRKVVDNLLVLGVYK